MAMTTVVAQIRFLAQECLHAVDVGEKNGYEVGRGGSQESSQNALASFE